MLHGRSIGMGGFMLAAAITVAGGVVAPSAAFAAPALRTWVGQGATGAWSDPGNWDVTPVSGDSVLFPATTVSTQHATVNDLPAGLQLPQITIAGEGYTIIGGPIGGVEDIVVAAGVSTTIDLDLDLYQAGSADIEVGTGSTLVIGGTVAGPDGFSKNGAGELRLNDSNAFSGEVNVNRGTLTVNAAGALGAPGSLSDGTWVGNGATLALTSRAVVAGEAFSIVGLGVDGAGALRADSGRITVSYLLLRDDARVGAASGSRLQLDLVEERRIGAFLTKVGDGLMTFDGTAAHSGGTIVRAGAVALGSAAAHLPRIRVVGPGTQFRTGATGSGPIVSDGGIIAALDEDDDARLILTSAFTLDGDSTLVIPFTGPGQATPTSQDGWGSVEADVVDLGGATLDLQFAPNFLPNDGDRFAIVRSTSPIIGTFTGLPEGGFITVDGTTFHITYLGGSGNDVVLTALNTLNIAFSTSATTVRQGDDVTLVAFVSTSSSSPIPGDVTFRVGSTVLGTSPISNYRAELVVDTLGVGDNVLTATYDGSSEYAPRSMTPVTVTVQGAPQFTASAPPTRASEGSAVSYTFAASGSPAPVFSLGRGTLPPGLALSPSGVLSGTATAHGIWTFEIEADNGIGTAQTIELTIMITAAPTFRTVTVPVRPRVGEALLYRIPVSGTPASVISVTGGTLPPGTTLDSTGRLTGTPTVAGVFDFTVTASNGIGSVSAMRRLTVEGNVLLVQPTTVTIPRVDGIPLGGANATTTRLARTGADGDSALTALAGGGLLLAAGALLLGARRRSARTTA